MLRPGLALLALVATAAPLAAQTAIQKCKSIKDSLERLRCYDAIQAEPAARPAPSASPAGRSEDPAIARAKEAVKAQLKYPGSARFSDVKVRTVSGKQAVCGLVRAKNASEAMAPPQPFAYDGEDAHLLIYNPGPANITTMSAKDLAADTGDRIRAYNRLCK
jgi:hypothetical protein